MLAGLSLMLSSFLAVAEAGEELVWRWEEGQHRRYLLRANLSFPELVPYDFANLMATESDVEFTVVIDCSVADTLGRRGWELACDL